MSVPISATTFWAARRSRPGISSNTSIASRSKGPITSADSFPSINARMVSRPEAPSTLLSTLASLMFASSSVFQPVGHPRLVLQQARPCPRQLTQFPPRPRRHETGPQQPAGQQPRNPLAVLDVGLAARNLLLRQPVAHPDAGPVDLRVAGGWRHKIACRAAIRKKIGRSRSSPVACTNSLAHLLAAPFFGQYEGFPLLHSEQASACGRSVAAMARTSFRRL